MSKNVSIKLENVQQIIDDQEKQQINNSYQGKFYIKNDKLYLSYADNAEGIDGSKTIVKIDPERERVLLLRQEPAAMKQDFVCGEKQAGYFKTAYGEIKMAVKTKRLEMEISEKSGLIRINYQVFLGGELNAEHHLKINYKILK
ncbi:MAG: hypothetical protein A8274_1227 [Halanaerobium sp. 4-GBenrich]|jgi:uncharacterized beta-barrel protein YwiB (DUF1934 family)|uniref:Uncharacterized beta-barrel protein YwiB (DUF1934 family) n=1 Tax=Halanaerobium congolense TaxID=54121 RepID=A0A1G6J0B6_9FIRM|nr:DUF1934 domain-containing protein [Halanaerobium congolense]KXS49815.1 MAG: hypothetical protein AWL62_701 [Halanaerobium sp. T82-1]ODS49817.1 MAG: hypothetical protein A8274_1227 [Halanaerobium sp. 4-GBenrich]PUU91727.1 MAG: hypothetical protein CI948_1018 [Halanaerobium sp.]PTX15837.1 uncharacterized beta-barrel protein YwiB (DUF1934 family) [Halanaerobium congolense]TDS33948.1 uncharacterized beta-barrel protein YwiB (DUF1934 family) [Halanaerobium congolense]